MNQAGDHDHVETTVGFDDETPDVHDCRVTGCETGEMAGFHQVLSHADCGYNAARDTQYLKDNCLIVML